jgi:hypothetical protein
MLEFEFEFGRVGVTWTLSAGRLDSPSLSANLRGSVDAGTTEALEGGRPRNGAGRDLEASAPKASLYRLLAGVALTWTAEARLAGFFISAETIEVSQ